MTTLTLMALAQFLIALELLAILYVMTRKGGDDK